MTSEIRANTLKNRVGLGTVSFTNTGPIVSGIVTANSFSGPISGTTGTFSGNVDINGDLDVDGHTNLDNVSVAGVSTFTGRIDVSDNIAITSGNRLYFGNSDVAFLKGEHGGSGYLEFGVNTAHMWLTRVGTLGLGNASPTHTLDVSGTGRFTDNLTINSGQKIFTNNSQGQLTIMGGATYPGSAIKFAGGQSGTTDQGQMRFYAGTSTSLQEKLRITSTGQFHMGGGNSWTYASQKFVVVEPNNNLGMLLQGNNANEGVNLTLQNIVNANNAYSSLSFADDGGQIFGVVRGKVIDKNANTGELQFHTSSNERLRISSSGDFKFSNNGGDNRIERNTTSGGPYFLFHNRGINTTDNSGVYNMGGISAAGYRDISNPSIVGSIQFERQPTSGGASSGCDIVFRTGFNGNTSHTYMPVRLRLSYSGHLIPGANNQYDLGSTTNGWRNIYTNDLNLSNINAEKNDIDGTQGSWTIQEGKDDLYIINRLNGKKFKIKMEEIL